jgi:outer membrane receptor protein involved in Fe transport
MQQKYWYCLLLLLLVPGVVFAQSAKIRGTVVDQKSKEPLIGANITVEGTNLGAATDVDGEFIILNVPIGTYTIKTSYVGYRTSTISNVRVSGLLTTEVKFELSIEDIQVQAVEIIAERPLVNKNATNAVRTTSAEDIKNIPVRGVGNLVSLVPGVVQQAGQIYIRGGRQEQVGYIIEGVQTRDVLFGGTAVTVNDNAIEEVQVQAGGYNAEYGGANAGIIITSLKTGTEQLKATAEIITDAWGTPGEKSLGAYSYGYNEYTATLGGPIPGLNSIKFFLSGDYQFNRTLIKRWEGMNLHGLTDPTSSNQAPIDLVYPAGYMLNNAQIQSTLNGNLMTTVSPFDEQFNIKVSGMYSSITQHGNNGNANTFRGTDLSQMLNDMRVPLTETQQMAGMLRISKELSPTTFVEVNLNYFQNYSETMDPYLKEKWWLYGDSAANAKYGFTLKADGEDPTAIVLFGTQIDSRGTLEAGYGKTKQVGYGAKAAIVHQEGKLHEFKLGGEYTQYVMRNWGLTYDFCQSYAKTLKNNPSLSAFDILKAVRLNSYGYDFLGQNEVDDIAGHPGFKPHEPIFASGYIQDKIEYQDLVINAGLRYDYIDIDQKVPVDPGNIPYDADGVMDYSKFVNTPTRDYISPRLGFSFSMSDQTVFHTEWGRFIQQSRLRDIYYGLVSTSVNIKGGNAIQNNIGWGLRPEQTTQYELGFNQMLTDNSSFDITVYYRDIVDQIQSRLTSREEGANHQTYFSFVNGDFATTKGVEFKFNLRRTNRIMAQAFYSYSDARSTGSNSATAFRTIWQSPTGTPFFPNYVSPVDYNQPHRGSINLDYRWAENDGGAILERLGLNLLFTFNSGHSYTRIEPDYGNTRVPTEELNASYTPWNYQLDFRIDKSFRIGSIDMNVYLLVINVLDTKNVQNVFLQTGTADDDGYLDTPSGKNDVNTYGQQFAQFYRAFLANGYGFEQGLDVFQDIWGPPRQYRLGLRVEL